LNKGLQPPVPIAARVNAALEDAAPNGSPVVPIKSLPFQAFASHVPTGSASVRSLFLLSRIVMFSAQGVVIS
jgi:hypothetical protein